MKPLAFVALLGLGGAQAAFALEQGDCRNGLFPRLEGLHLAKAAPGASGKVYFRNDDEGCPAKDACEGKAYVIAGDEMLVTPEAKGWVCAWYFSKKHEIVGWVRATEVTPLPTRTPALAEWAGAWKGAGAELEIAADKDGSLHVTGMATWLGATLENGEQVVHDGEIDDSAKPSGNRLEIGDTSDEYACHVVFTLVNGYLVANDSGYCGGVNVNFSDVYRRAPKAKQK